MNEEKPSYLVKAERFCAMGEQCEYAVREKLRQWGANDVESDEVVSQLKEVGFLDESRYAQIYCRSKVRLQRWGRRKIQYQLRMKHLPDALIREGLASVSDEDYAMALHSVAENKWKSYAKSDPRRKYKLVAFLQSRGFEMDEIMEELKNLNNLD